MASNIPARIPPLFNDLVKILTGEIDCSHETLTMYSTDGSPYVVLPQAVIYPKNVTDIKHILSFAREYKIPVTVRGNGGTKNGGSLGEGVILDMKRYFSQIRNVNMMENTVTVDAGVTTHSLLEKLHSWQFDIPLLIGSDKNATVGALIGAKSCTGSSFHHGTIREWIEGLSVVVDNGEEHKLADGIMPSGRLLGIYQEVFPLLTKESGNLRAAKPKFYDDSTGYNLWSTAIGPRQLIDQLTGSEGTLGIITSVTFRISRYKPHSLTTCIPVANRGLIPTYIAIAKHHKGEHIFLYDETFMELSERYHPTLVPSFPNSPYVLLVTHTGSDKEKLHHTVRTFKNSLPVFSNSPAITFEDRTLLTHITSTEFLFSLYSMYTNDALTPLTIADGLIIDTHELPSFLEELEDCLNTFGKLYTIRGNIGSGHIAVTALFDTNTKEYANLVSSYTRSIFSLVKKYNGGISAINGEGLARTPFLSYCYNDIAISIFKKVKEIWDPFHILNPGKKYSATTDYLQQHLR